MFRIKQNELYASDIASYLNKELHGDDFLVTSPFEICIFSVENIKVGEGSEKILYLIADNERVGTLLSYIPTQNPELDLTLVLNEFFFTS